MSCTLIHARVDYEVQGCVDVYMCEIKEIQAILSSSFTNEEKNTMTDSESQRESIPRKIINYNAQ